MENILDPNTRKAIIEEILGDENKRRKAESFRRMQMYQEKQREYILEKLRSEFSEKTVREMRTVTSINLVKRIVDSEASIYKTEPKRTFTASSALSESEELQINNLYELSWANTKLKKANKMFKLQDQCCVQIVPIDGKIEFRVLSPHQYDMLPDDMNPEKAGCFIISNFDKTPYLKNPTHYSSSSLLSRNYGDGVNQRLADQDDHKRNMRIAWWTKELNLITDGNGNLLSEDVINPIQMLPFIDVAGLKDLELWLNNGSSLIDFSIDFGVSLSDLSNIARLQGYAQAIILSEKLPQDMIVGPNSILHLPLDPNKEIQPSFQFATPNPDLQGGLNLLEQLISLFLTSKGIDPKTISGRAESTKFSSGLERLLANIEKFEATKDDFDIFKMVELKTWNLMKAWSNAFQSVTLANPQTGTMPLIDDLRLALIPEDTKMSIQFHKPEAVQTKSELEDSAIKLVGEGLLSKSEAISQLRGVDLENAKQILEQIDQEAMMFARSEVGVQPEAQNKFS